MIDFSKPTTTTTKIKIISESFLNMVAGEATCN
jgi:hypothetical protein